MWNGVICCYVYVVGKAQNLTSQKNMGQGASFNEILLTNFVDSAGVNGLEKGLGNVDGQSSTDLKGFNKA